MNVFVFACGFAHSFQTTNTDRRPHKDLICDQGTSPAGGDGTSPAGGDHHSTARTSECHFTDQLLSERLPLLSYWHGKEFPLDHDSAKAASAPGGHQGADKRFELAVGRLLRGDHLVISVLGGSMTFGHKVNVSWPKRLEQLFQSLGYKVTVNNLAQPASTSKWASANIQDLRTHGLDNSHVVMVDYGLNDRDIPWKWDEGSYSSAGGVKEVQDSFTDLMALLIDLGNRPAVIDVETFSNLHNGPPECSNFNIQAYHNHWDVLEKLDIPTVCLMSAICNSKSASPEEWWFGSPKESGVHPGDETHDLVARTVLGAFLIKMESVCAHGGPKGSDYPPMAPRSDALQCLSKPTTYHHANHGKETFAPASNTTWNFEEDVPGKPGWIARGEADIEFKVTTQSGWLQMEFLGTYKDIGSATVWIDAKEPGKWDSMSMGKSLSCRIDGLWDDTTSQSRFALMKAFPGDHVVHLRSKGPKFKLLHRQSPSSLCCCHIGP